MSAERGGRIVERGPDQALAANPIPAAWHAALAEAWAAYCSGSYPIGAVIVDGAGNVIARGRNRLGEARGAEGGQIGGHDLAHAEINALLNVADMPRPEVYSWTLLTTVEPCPQCAGAIAMSGIRAVQYAAPDPWAGCTRLLTNDPYVAKKGIAVGRAPDMVQAAALRLVLVGFLEANSNPYARLLQSFTAYPNDLNAARALHASGTVAALREQKADLNEVLPVLLAGWTPTEADLLPTVHTSEPDNRTGRACVWIEHQDRILMTELESGGWTLPGGGIHPGEEGGAAAMREAWEECGAVVEITGETVFLTEGTLCFPARLHPAHPELHPSLERRARAWINPRALPWADDKQIRQVLEAWNQTPPTLALPPRVAHALAEAARLNFDRCCSLEAGRLLRTLAATRPGARLAELESGTGVSAAWLLSGMSAGAHLLTIESDAQRAAIAREVLKGDARVTALHGDWQAALSHGPFDLIFSDSAPAKRETEHLKNLVDALNLGGMLVLDNFSPPALLPAALHGGDPERERLWSHPHLSCSEVAVSVSEHVILAVRVS
ncbi:deaminase [Deinococcus sp. QL22]|uniref:deaminase n=1 Tax=Deinococcus sp. QL22 TaxID=2939437 RepID=UPI00201824D5|nr:deaminase [Deinococcus sp. QL22]UQN07613.1 deaminase [Deinococcus sp. QL22]